MPARSKAEKQADRKADKKVGKAEGAATVSGDGLFVAVKQLALGSILAEVLPLLPRLMKGEKVEAPHAEDKENKDENEEKKEETNGDSEPKCEEKLAGADSVFESLITRLPTYSTLGLDKTPEEEIRMFTQLEVDFGPYKRKNGNAAMERIMVNLERNLSQYINMLLFLMVANALVFRSYFACLPWLVAYQLLSLHMPMDVIRENIPQVPEVDVKFRVVATMAIHVMVWSFFLYEFLFATYLLAKLPLIGLFAIHAYVVAPEADVEVARQAVKDQSAAELAEEKSEPTKGAANAGSFILRIKLIVVESFVVKMAHRVPELIRELKGATAKKAEPKKDDGDEKDTSSGSAFEPLIEKLSIYNALGLGLAATADEYRKLAKPQLDFGPKAEKGNPMKERLMTNFESFMHLYLHIMLGLMCVRSFLFRSWFACLPWLLGYQMLCLSFPLIRQKLPQVPPVEFIFRVAAAALLHALMWLFFVYEATFMTYLSEKVFLTVVFVGHAYVVSPVVD